MTLTGQRMYRRSVRTQEEQRGFHRAFTTLTLAIERVVDEGGAVPCVAQPTLYHEPDRKPSSLKDRREVRQRFEKCAVLCASCPVLEICCAYADEARAQQLAGGNYLPTRGLVAA